ncbi:hypothetical protein BG841_01995 [Marinobacter sp. X15-166B]|nr:hypothetical protein BG841_01995 [Marinobacter sp. X15-166B]
MLVAGGLIEWLQGSLDRAADWHDMGRNLIGAWLVLAWAHRPRRSATGVGLARLLVTALLLWELGLVAVIGLRQWQLAIQLPLLYDFAQPDPQRFWDGQVQRSTRYSGLSDREFSLRVELDTERYSGASLDNLASDWRDYRHLVLILYNPDQDPLAMTLRINDRAHDRGNNAYEDRFHTRLVVAPGLNRFAVPLTDVQQAPAGRAMAMDAIRRLLLFTSRQPAPRTVYLLDLRLQ